MLYFGAPKTGKVNKMNNTDENLIKLFIQKYKNAKDDNERKTLFLDKDLVPDHLLKQVMVSSLVEYWQTVWCEAEEVKETKERKKEREKEMINKDFSIFGFFFSFTYFKMGQKKRFSFSFDW